MMRLVVGMGSVDDYIDYVKAGADEIFIGYVPQRWQEKYGLTTPLNRREVCYYNVQIGSYSELEILSGLVGMYGVPVTITLNGLHYTKEQHSMIAEIIEECLSLGFHSFIVADLALILYLHQSGLAEKIDLHISGELGEINHYMEAELERLGMDRLIFHRKMTMRDMGEIIQRANERTKFEAFYLNENCHFHGGYCNSLHCDEWEPICRLEYRLVTMAGQKEIVSDGSLEDDIAEKVDMEEDSEVDTSGVGASGCGLCSLWKMREMGVTHLKIVGRGAYTEDMIRDIKVAKKSLAILERSDTDEEYRKVIRERYCSGNCYYYQEDHP